MFRYDYLHMLIRRAAEALANRLGRTTPDQSEEQNRARQWVIGKGADFLAGLPVPVVSGLASTADDPYRVGVALAEQAALADEEGQVIAMALWRHAAVVLGPYEHLDPVLLAYVRAKVGEIRPAARG